MPTKSDPWKKPKDNAWIKVGALVVAIPASKVGHYFGYASGLPSADTHGNPETPFVATPHVITRIQVTGNGTRMIHVALAESVDKKEIVSRWECDFIHRWIPLPKKRNVKPRPKKVRASRFDRDEPV